MLNKLTQILVLFLVTLFFSCGDMPTTEELGLRYMTKPAFEIPDNIQWEKVGFAKEKYLFLDQKRKQLADLRKKMIKLGLNPNEHDVFTRPEYREKWLKSQLKT